MGPYYRKTSHDLGAFIDSFYQYPILMVLLVVAVAAAASYYIWRKKKSGDL
jgi:hypothetical protein